MGNLLVSAAVAAGDSGANSFALVRQGDQADVSLDGHTVYSAPLAALSSITVDASGPHDTLSIDLSGGDPLPKGGVQFNGVDDSQDPADNLVIDRGSYDGTIASVTERLDGGGSGSIGVVLGDSQSAGAGTTITYAGVRSVTDDTGANYLSVQYAGPDGVLSIGGGNTASGSNSTVRTADGSQLTFLDPAITLGIKTDLSAGGKHSIDFGNFDSGSRMNLDIQSGANDSIRFDGRLDLHGGAVSTETGGGGVSSSSTTFGAASIVSPLAVISAPPTVVSVTPSVGTITDANVGTDKFSLTVVYDKAMNTTIAPIIGFPTQNPSATISLDAGASGWTNNTTYVAEYNVSDVNVTKTGIDVRVTHAKDTAGNLQVADTVTADFNIDTRNPTVISVTPSVATITDANVGTDGLSLTVVYNKTMDTTVAPTIGFPTQDPGATLSLDTSTSGWTNGATYVAEYNVADVGVTQTGIDVQVTGGRDTVGNGQVSDTAHADFSVDTRNPTVLSLTPSIATITDSTVGAHRFSLTVVYDKPMNTAVAPTIGFPGQDPSSTLSLNIAASKWRNATTYVAEYDVADASVTQTGIDVQVTGGRDTAGNAQVADTAAAVFDIDTRQPTVVSVTPSVATITDANVGADGFSLTVVYDKPMDTTVTPRLTVPRATLSLDTANSGWTNDTTYVAEYNVNDVNTTRTDINVRVTRAKDAVGNTQVADTASADFNIDTQNPTVVSVTPSVPTIADANVSTDGFSLTVVYSEAMDTTVTPTIGFPGQNPGATLALDAAASGWTNGTTYVAEYDVTDANVTQSGIDVQVTGGHDAIGNTQVEGDAPGDFNIDTQNPTVVSVTPSVPAIADANVGADGFSLTVVYSEAMDTTVAPTIGFPSQDPGATLSLETAASGWTNGSTYVAEYNVTDANVTQSGIDVQVTGGRDAVENVQIAGAASADFSIDTQNPTVVSVTPSVPTIADVNTGTDGFSLTVVYSETMDTTVTPTIGFPGQDPGATVALDTAASGWANGTTFVAEYNVTDANVTQSGIDVQVTGGRDAVENVQIAGTAPADFNIDTQNPTVVSVTPSVPAIADANVGADGFSLTVVYSEAMDTTVVPAIGFPSQDPSATLALDTAASGWTNDTTYVASYNVTDANVTQSGIDIQVTGGHDAVENVQITGTAPADFGIDTQNPTVVSVTPSVPTIADANVGTDGFSLTVVYSETMDTTVTPTIGFPGQDPSATLSLDTAASGWTNGTTYVAEYNVTDANVTQSGIDVQVTSGHDAVENVQITGTAPGDFNIDTQNPTVVSVTPSVPTIADANVGADGFSLTVVYSETMDTTVIPTIGFPSQDPSATLSLDTAASGWTNGTTYVAEYNVTDANVAQSGIDVQVTGSHDAVENVQITGSAPADFNIDTQNPTVVSVTPSVPTIADANVGADGFSLTVVYSEAMDTAVTPTIGFPGQDPSATLALDTAASGWTNDTTYVADYNVTDANVTQSGIDVQVTGGRDAVENVQISGTAPADFNIDTENPTVVSVTPSVPTIADANVGTDGFSLTVVYSEAMDTTVVPTIGFPSQDPSATLALDTAASGWTNDTTYVASYNVTDVNVAQSGVDVQVTGAQDAVGNTQVTGSAPADFNIDTQNPTVVSVSPSVPTIADANVGVDGFSLTVVYSETMDTTVTPTVGFPGQDPSATLSLDTANSGWTNGTTYVAEYNVTDVNVTQSGVDVQVTGAQDAVGNTQVTGSAPADFNIDTQNPTVVSVSPSVPTIADANVGVDGFSLTVVYSETMDTTVTPTVGFPGQDPSATLSLDAANSGWTNGTTYVAEYNVTDVNVTQSGVDVQVTGAQDAVGNTQVTGSAPADFNIDTQNPTVVSVSPSVPTIADASVGVDGFSLTVVYSEAMDTTVTPTIGFPGQGPSATLSLDTANGGWTNSTTYVAEYNVADANVTQSGIDVQVTGGRDAVENVQITGTAPADFSIDTQNPTVVSVTPSVPTIADANVGTDGFSLTVVYSETMDTTVAPTIGFPSQDPSATLALDTAASGWANGTTYVAEYNVTDANVTQSGIDVQVIGGRDAVENVQITGTAPADFNIDTQNPTVVSVTPSVPTIADANVGADGFSLTVVYSESMDTTVAPTIGFPGLDPSATLALDTAASGWTNGTTYVAEYNVTDANVTQSGIDVQVTGGRDAVENVQITGTAPADFNIDTQNPTVLSVTPSVPTIADANVGTDGFSLTVVYSESMDTTVTPSIGFPAQDPGATLSLDTANSGWTNGTTYVAEYNVTDANVTQSGIDVQVIGGRDAVENIQIKGTAPADFSIDTQNPTVLSVTPNVPTIADANVGADGFSLTVVYSESMDTTVTPTIGFPGQDPGATIALDTAASGWTNGTTYVAEYNVTDANVVQSGIDVRVTDGHDAVENVQVTDTSPTNFDIHTLKPSVAISALGSNPTDQSPIDFTVIFGESVADFATGDVTIGGTAGASTAIVTGSGTTYNVAVSGMTRSGTVIIGLAAGVAHDSVGNENVAGTLLTPVQYDVTEVSVDGSGDLVIDDSTSIGQQNLLKLSVQGGYYHLATDHVIVSTVPGTLNNGTTTVDVPLSSVAAGGQIILDTGAKTDTLSIDTNGGNPIPSGGLIFDGVGGSNSLAIDGTGIETVIYRPSNVAGTSGDQGSISLDGRTVQFDGLSPIDVANVASFTISPVGVNDVLAVANGDNLTDGISPIVGSQSALTVSGTTDLQSIANAAVWNVGTFVVDTSAAASGDDMITVLGANGGALAANITNLAIDTSSAGTDAVSFAGGVSIAGTLTISSNGPVTQSAAIAAAGLELLGAGPFTLTNASNDVGTLATDTSGAIEYQDASALVIGMVGGTTGITTMGENVSIQTGGTLSVDAAVALGIGALTIDSAGAVSQTAAIGASGLELLGAGPFTLTNALNDVGTLAANATGAIEYRDATTLVIGTVGSTTGITTTGENVSIRTGGTIAVHAAIALGVGDLTIDSAGALSQTAAITAAALELLGAGPFTLTTASNDIGTLAADTTGAIEYRDGSALTIGTVGGTTGITTTDDNVSIQTGGTLAVDAAVALGAGDLTIDSAGAVSQSASITAAGLELLGAGPFTLTNASNDVGTLAADTTGAIEYRDASALVIGTVGSTTGITTTGDNVSIQTGGTLSVDAAVALGVGDLTIDSTGAVSQTASITAAGLELLGAGPFTLMNASNDVGTLAAKTTGTISYQNSVALVIATVGGTTGITTTDDNVSIQTGGTLAIDAAIALGAGDLTIDSTGMVSQTAAITAAGLELLGPGPFTLTNASNDVGTLAAHTTGAIEYQDASALTIGTVGGTTGITTTDDNVSIQTDGTLAMDAAIALGAGDLTIDSAGAVSQTASITASGLELLGAGPFTLTNASNDVGTLAADTTGTIEYQDATALVIGMVGGTTGITTTGEKVSLETGGTLAVDAAIALGAGDLTIDSAGAVSQTASITAAGMELLGAGPFTLTNASNDVGTLASDTTGAISYQNSVGLMVGTVGGTTGIATTGDNVSLETNGTLAVDAAIALGAGDLTIDSTGAVSQTAAITSDGLELLGAGPFTLTNASNDVGTLAANTTGAIEYRDASALVIGTTGSTTGITTTGENVSIRTSGTLAVNAGIALSAGDMTIDSTGAVSQTVAIKAAGLELLGSGPFTLTNASNDIGTIAANTTGAIEYREATALTIGMVGGTTGITNTGENVSIQTGGTLAVNAAVALGAGDLTIDSAGAVSQSASITAAGLELLGAGPFTLTNASNDVGTLAADTTAAIEYRDATALVIGMVGGMTGITTTGENVSIQTDGTLDVHAAIGLGAGDLTIDSTGAVSQTALITAAGLELLGAGPFTLTNASNDVGTLAVNTTGAIEYRDATALAIDTVGGTTGFTTTGENVSIQTGGTLAVSAAIALGIGDLTIDSAGAVSQSASITAAGLELLGAGPFTLTNASNDVGTLAADTTGTIEYQEATALVIGMVGGTTGITTTGKNVSIQTGGTLAVDAAVALGAGNLTIDSAGAVSQTAAITAAGLELLGAGPFTLANAANDIGTFAANTSGAIKYQDATALTIGTVGGTTGITTTGDNVSLETGGTLSVNAAIALGAGDLKIDSTGAVSQTAAITASGLELLGVGPFTLTNAANDVGTLAANTTGAIEYRDATVLTIGTVGGTTGITTTGDNVSIQTGGTLAVDAAIALGAGDLAIDSAGAVSQTAAITASGLELLGTGPFTLTNASNDVGTLAANTTGAIEYQDASALVIGTVGGTTGITTTGKNVSIQTGGTLAVDAAVALGAGNLTIDSTGAVSQAAAIKAAGLELLGAGPFTLTNASNDVGILAANTTDAIEYQDISALTIGTVGGTIGITTTGEDVSIQTGGTLAVDAAIALGVGDLTIDSAGGVSQTAAITANGLELLGAGPFTLTNASNDIGTLAANTSEAIEYRDATALVIGTVGGTSGITTTGEDVSIQTGGTLAVDAAITLGIGDLTINSTGAVSQTAAITAAGLELLGPGPFTLTNASNDVGTLAASTTGAIEYQDASALVIATVGGTTGITTTGQNVSIQTGGTLAVDAAIALGAGDLTINSTGAVSQTAAITANGLELLGAGPFTLTNASNDVGTLVADTTGTISYQNSGALVIGTVGGTTGITTTSDNVSIQTGGTLAVDAAIALGAGDLTINSTGAVSQTAAIMASGLELLGAGPFTLTNASNDVDTLAVNTTGAIEYRDASALTIGTVGGTTGIATTGDNVSIETAGTLSVDAAISLGAGDLTIDSTSAVSQTAAITASGLKLLGAGPFTLTNASNDVGTLAANTTGAIEYQDASALVIGTVGGTAGITTTDKNVSIQTNGTLAVDAAIVLGVGDLTIDSIGAVSQTAAITASGVELLGAGPFTLTNASNDVGTLAADTTGAIEYQDASALVIGTVGGTAGITTTDKNVSIQTNGTLAVDAAIVLGVGDLTIDSIGAVSQTAAITASGVELLGAGPFTLTNASNDVGTLAANTSGTIEYQDASALTIGTVGGTTGITTTGENVSLETGGTLAVDAAIALGSGDLTIDSTGAVSQTALITAAGLELLGAGPFTLTNASNDVGTLAADTTGAITLTNDNASSPLTIGTVGGTTGITTHDHDLSITASNGGILVDSAVDVGSGGLSIASQGGSIQGSGSLNAGVSADISATAGISLSGPITVTGPTDFTVGNGADVLVGNSANAFGGQVTFTASAGSIRNVTIADSLPLAMPALSITGDLQATSSGLLTIPQLLSIGGTANLTGAGISETGIGAITVTGPTTLDAGAAIDIVLGNTLNSFTTVSIVSAKNVTLDSAHGMDLGVSDITGNLSAAALLEALTISKAVTVGGTADLSGIGISETAPGGSLSVTGTTTLTAGATNDIALGSSNNQFGTVKIVSGRNTAIEAAGGMDLGASTVSGDLSATALGNQLTISGSIAVHSGTATLTGVGIRETGGSIDVSGLVTLSGGTGDVILASILNQMSDITVPSANNLNLVDSVALDLGSSTAVASVSITTTGNAALDLVGPLDQTGSDGGVEMNAGRNLRIDSTLDANGSGGVDLMAGGNIDILPPSNNTIPAIHASGGGIEGTAGGTLTLEPGTLLKSRTGQVTTSPPEIQVGQLTPGHALTPADRVQALTGTAGAIILPLGNVERGANFTIEVFWSDNPGTPSVLTGVAAGDDVQWQIQSDLSSSATVSAGSSSSGPATLIEISRNYPLSYLRSLTNPFVTATVVLTNTSDIVLKDSGSTNLNSVTVTVQSPVARNQFLGQDQPIQSTNNNLIVLPQTVLVITEAPTSPPQQNTTVEENRTSSDSDAQDVRIVSIVKVGANGEEGEPHRLPENVLIDLAQLFKRFRIERLPNGLYRIYLKDVGFPKRKVLEFYKSGNSFGDPVHEPGQGSKPAPKPSSGAPSNTKQPAIPNTAPKSASLSRTAGSITVAAVATGLLAKRTHKEDRMEASDPDSNDASAVSFSRVARLCRRARRMLRESLDL